MAFRTPDPTDDYPISGTARREAVLRIGFFILLAVAITTGYALTQFRGLREPVAMETAEIARHLAAKEGFVTRCIRPFDLWYLQTHGITRNAPDAAVPALWTAPGLPVLQAALFRWVRPHYAPRHTGGFLNDAETRVIVPLGVVLTLLTTLVVWLLGRVLFGQRPALLAAGAYLTTDLTLSSSISGLPTPATALMATLALLLAVLAGRRSAITEGGWRVAGLTGMSALCAAAAVLTDYAMLVVAMAAAALLVVELQRRRWRMFSLFLLVLALALTPWILHNRALGIGPLGALPYAALRETPLFPADALERSTAPVFNAYRTAAAIRQGFASRLTLMAGGSRFLQGGVMICFFILALFHRYENSLCHSLKTITLVSLVTLMLLPTGPGTAAGAAWPVLYPIMVLFGMSAFLSFLEKEDYFDVGIKPVLMSLLLALCMLPAGLRAFRGPAGAYPPYHGPIQRFAAGVPQEGKVLLTDIPWATTWYGGGTSVLLPLTPDEVTALPGGWASAGGLYLTGAAAAHEDTLWALMRLGREVPPTLPFTHGISLPAGRNDQLLLTGSEYWTP